MTAKPHGLDPTENMIKEAAEEASVPRHLAKNLKAAGLNLSGQKVDVADDLENPDTFLLKVLDACRCCELCPDAGNAPAQNIDYLV